MDAEIVSAQKGRNFSVHKRTPCKFEIKKISSIINIKPIIINPGQTHYNCIQHKTGFQARFPGSKSRNNALHTDCCKVTIELSAHAAATIRVFLPQEPFLRANFT